MDISEREQEENGNNYINKSSIICTLQKLNKIIIQGHVAQHIGKMRNTCKILIRKSERRDQTYTVR
jgi:hypothetical protein